MEQQGLLTTLNLPKVYAIIIPACLWETAPRRGAL
jgi:hypothetical protein